MSAAMASYLRHSMFKPEVYWELEFEYGVLMLQNAAKGFAPEAIFRQQIEDKALKEYVHHHLFNSYVFECIASAAEDYGYVKDGELTQSGMDELERSQYYSEFAEVIIKSKQVMSIADGLAGQ